MHLFLDEHQLPKVSVMIAKALSARFVETVKVDPAVKRAAFPDRAVDGLELRVSVSGRKSWAFRYVRKRDNARRRVTLGRFPDISLQKARLKAIKLRVEIADDRDPAEAAFARKTAISFATIAEDWFQRHAVPNKAPRSVADNRSMLGRDILPVIGAMKAAEVQKRDIIMLFDDMMGRVDVRSKRSPTERKLTTRPNRVYEVIRSICRWAVGRDLLQFDPTWGMKQPLKTSKPRDRALSTDEIAVLWTALDRAPAQRRHVPAGLPRTAKLLTDTDLPMTRPTALAIKLALVNGQRIGEVCGTAEEELSTELAPVSQTREKGGISTLVKGDI